MIIWRILPDFTEYHNSIEIMENSVQKVIDTKSNETIYLLEYPSLYTVGTGDKILKSTIANVPIINASRGGKTTYHGPGQRIIYPILNLDSSLMKKDLHLYVQMLQQWIINCLEEIGIKAFIIKDLIGVWVLKNFQPHKIASIGIRVKKWVSYYGISINISPDLTFFDHIIPCGISKFQQTSLHDLSCNITFKEFDLILQKQFYKVFSTYV